MKRSCWELLSAEWSASCSWRSRGGSWPVAILFGPAVAAPKTLSLCRRDGAQEAIATGTELPEDSDAYRFRKYAKKYTRIDESGWGRHLIVQFRMKWIADEHMEYLERAW